MKKLFILFFFLCHFVLSAQTITSFAGNGTSMFSGNGTPAISAGIPDAEGGVFDKYGNYYFCDGTINKVRKIDVAGIITTIAGTGVGTFGGDSGLAIDADIYLPQGVILDTFGNIYFCDAGNNRIRKIDAVSGIISTIVGTGMAGYAGDSGLAVAAKLWDPQSICFDKFGNLYISDLNNYRIRKVNASGIITTFAGTGTMGYPVDGVLATSQDLDFPIGLIADDTGNIYISDPGTFSSRVRKVNTAGIISTVAGNGSYTYAGDGIAATSAQISPYILAFDSTKNLYISDRYNQRAYKIDMSGIIHSVAGNGAVGWSGNGGPAIAAELDYPTGVALDPCGNLYIPEVGSVSIDLGKNIRKVLFNPISATPMPTINILSTLSDTVCFGTSATFNAVVAGGGTSSYFQWYVNTSFVGSTSSSYTYTPHNGDSVRCIIYTGSKCATPATATSNTIHIVVDTTTTPAINITASTGDTICPATSVTFTAVASAAGSAPAYQWIVNGIDVGSGGSTYTYSPANGDTVRCVLTSSYACAAVAMVSSNTISMAVGVTESPTIFITAYPRDSVCIDTPVTFTASISLGGTSPLYQWVVDGINVGTSINTYTFTPANGDSVRCILTSSASCAIPSIVSSNTVNMTVNTCSSLSIFNTTLSLNNITISPNPATNELTIQSTNSVMVSGVEPLVNQITIYNIIGQSVFSEICNTEKAEINISSLPAGVYMVNIIDKQGNKTIKKIIKQ